MADEKFAPRLGRIRALGGASAKRYLGKVYAAMEKARPGAFTKRTKGRFTGNRIGRGAGLGAAFAYKQHPFAKFRSRRVTVKIRSVRLGGKGLAKARAHLRYIQRDGADKDGAPGKLYGPKKDVTDGKAFLQDGNDDRHQFRIILSPEEAGDLADLKSHTRDVMSAAEKDLGTKLDWVAVNHFDTDHPHVHIVLRGRADDGKDLVIARNYITHGFRRRAEELATLELGRRRDIDIARVRVAEAKKERFTGLDRALLDHTEEGVVHLAKPQTTYDQFQRRLLLARLRTLEDMKLATRENSEWRLSPHLETSLKELGRRGDIIRSMGVALGPDLSASNVREFGGKHSPLKLIGRVAGSGAADDAHDSRFLAIDGADGNQWHVAVNAEPGAAPPKGAVIEAVVARVRPRKSDLVIAAIAERNGGQYSDALHAEADSSARSEFRLAHKRRLEALRRAEIVERNRDGSWRIPQDYLDRAAQFESKTAAARIRVLSWVKLETLTKAHTQTFLDDALESKNTIEAVDNRFGADLKNALVARRRWLLREGLAMEADGKFNIDRDRLRALERGAMNEAAASLGHKLGKAFIPSADGERISGVYRQSVDLPTGRFAIVAKSKEFSLVPWREALERRRGMEVSGVMRRSGVSWTFGKSRGGPMR